MFRRLLKFLVYQIFILLLIFLVSRLIIRALPGDPVDVMLAESGSSFQSELLRKELHLDRPFLESLWLDLKDAASGNLGVSLISKEPVSQVILNRTGFTLILAFLSLSIALIIALPVGVWGAARPGSWVDRLCSGLGYLSSAIPLAWSGPILILMFCVWIPIFPLGHHVALPALCLSLQISGSLSRLIRNRVRDVLRHGAAPGARARGLPEWVVLLKYGFAPASSTLLGYLGTQFGSLLGGSVLTEIIFDWPGLGSLMVESVLKRDYPLVETGFFLIAAFVLIGNATGDLLQVWVHPKLRDDFLNHGANH